MLLPPPRSILLVFLVFSATWMEQLLIDCYWRAHNSDNDARDALRGLCEWGRKYSLDDGDSA